MRIVLKYALFRTDRVALCWIEMSWLWLWGWLRCKCYKDAMYTNVLYYEVICNMITSFIWIVWNNLWSYNYYWAIGDDDYTRGRPYDPN